MDKLEPKSLTKLIYEVNLAIRWGDMDAFAHVNNATYFRYFEEARVQWLASLGYNIDEDETGPVIINANATFLKPIIYPADLTVQLYANPPGNSSMVITQHIVSSSKPETLFTEGSVKIVWVNQATGKSVPLPDKIRELLLG